MVTRHRVPETARGQRLDAYLAAAVPELSRARAQALIEEGHVHIDDRAPKPSVRLKGGELVTVEIPPPRATAIVPEALPLDVLYEDAELLVLNKAAGVVVHPAAGHAGGTLVNALMHRWKGWNVGGEERPGIVHRLDKDTSGCLVVARETRTLEALQSAFRCREVEKTYLALVHGHPAPQRRLETLYGRHPVHRKRFTSKLKSGKSAVTEWTVEETFPGAALLHVSLHTGRTHQIRVHLSEAGHPLLGDPVYGSKRSAGPIAEIERALGRQALHAWRLAFAHPRTGKRLSFEAPPPPDFEAARKGLRAAPTPG